MVSSPFILHHGEDPDGLIADALLSAYCEDVLQEYPAGHYAFRYDTLPDLLPRVVSAAEKAHPSQIFIADINLNPETVEKEWGVLLDRLVKSCSLVHLEQPQVYWFDHHQETEQQKEDYLRRGIEVIYSSQQCASLLIAKHLGLDQNLYFHRLASIAQAHDYAKPGQMNEPLRLGNLLEGIIALANAESNDCLLRRLSRDLRVGRCLADGTSLTPFWEKHAQRYDQLKPEAMRKMEESVVLERVGDYQVLFALAPPILSQKPAPRHLREKYTDADVIVCLFAAPYQNHLVLGKKDSPLDLVQFCRSRGGGGRGNAGGFRREKMVTEVGYPAVREEIKVALEEFVQSRPA